KSLTATISTLGWSWNPNCTANLQTPCPTRPTLIFLSEIACQPSDARGSAVVFSNPGTVARSTIFFPDVAWATCFVLEQLICCKPIAAAPTPRACKKRLLD